MKRNIRLTESQLRNVIKQSVRRMLSESPEFNWNEVENNPPKTQKEIDDELERLRYQMIDRSYGNGYEYDPVDKELDNDYSWGEHEFHNHIMRPQDLDYEFQINNERLYGNEDQIDKVGKMARDKWVNGASPDYIEGLTDIGLGEAIKKTVRNVINEIKADDPHENLRATNDALEGANNNIGGLEDALAELMVDNNLTFEDVEKYENLMRFIDPQQLDQEIDRYKNFLEQDKLDDKRREAQAWAEEQMSDMGFGYEED